MNEPKECSWCDQIILDTDETCQSCGNIVPGSKLDIEMEKAQGKYIEDELDKFEVQIMTKAEAVEIIIQLRTDMTLYYKNDVKNKHKKETSDCLKALDMMLTDIIKIDKLKEKLRKEYADYTESVKRYEEMRRNTTDEF